MFEDYIKEFDCTLAQAVQFTGVPILILGFSNFLWVPISTSFGRRPVYLASQLICLASCIWRARATTYNSFMGACALNGVGAGPAETIQPAVIADIFFLHDRGKWNTLYWVVYMGSLMVGPIISGPMALTVGWRNFWWLNVALLGFSFLLVAFGFPETKWNRVELETAKSSPPGNTPPNEKAIASNEQPHEKSSPPAQEEIESAPVTSDNVEASDPWLGRGAPSKRQWALFQPNAHPFKSILMDLWIPWKMMVFPIVQFASFVVSWSCSSFLTINLTQTQAFAPRGFSSLQIGFMNFAILVGAFIGLATAGPLSDWIAARLTKRNGGIREPEMRLPAMIPYVVIMYLGNVRLSHLDRLQIC
jgi:MFS family permease